MQRHLTSKTNTVTPNNVTIMESQQRIPFASAIAFALFVGAPACTDSEQGINRTFIEGAVVITPERVLENESNQRVNDDPSIGAVKDLGFVGARYVEVSGSCLDFSAEQGGDANGDLDYYTFIPLADGTVTLGLNWDDVSAPSGDTGEEVETENAIYQINVTDEDEQSLLEGNTEGYYGSYSADVELTAGVATTVLVAGRRNLGDNADYELVISGFDPNDSSFMVGAYLNDDIENRGDPVGGAEVQEFTLDEASRTWYGEYKVYYIRGVTTCSDDDAECLAAAQNARMTDGSSDSDTGASSDTGTSSETEDTGTSENADTGSSEGSDTGTSNGSDTGSGGSDSGAGGSDSGSGGSDTDGSDDGDAETDTAEEPGTSSFVNENIEEIYLFAGNFGSLNSGLTSGTLYSADPVHIGVGNGTLCSVVITCDTIQPKIYGWGAEDTEPNTVSMDADSGAITGFSSAQVLEVGSGAGVVDTISGTLDYETDDPQWDGENDAFAITVDEEADATITMSWGDDSYNIDLNLNGSDGELWADGWSIADVNPEVMTVSEFEFTFEPGETYYLVVAPWAGSAGSVDYAIEIEWLAP